MVMKHETQSLNWPKFKELVHYICEKAEDPSCLGAIKLNKVLWYSDVVNYLATGRSITGETYVKRQHGPVPRDVLRAIQALVKEGKIERGKVDHFGWIKNEYISIFESDKNMFSGSEMSFIDAAFQHVCMQHTAMSVSEETHDQVWKMADMGEIIPYEAVFASMVGEVDETDLDWAKAELQKAA
jgi:uncharacterized phage-associated protein